MREAGRIVAMTLLELEDHLRPGVSTAQLDRIAEKTVTAMGAEAAFKGYNGFPASLCASINDEIVHGIPSPDSVLKEGDIISLDFGAIHQGYFGDAAVTLGVGKISQEAERLLQVTKEALHQGVRRVKPG